MRQLILCFAFALTIYIAWINPVFGISCTVNSECPASTVCGGANSEPICQHPDGAEIVTGGGLCTCSAGGSDLSCNYPSDCYDLPATILNCSNADKHCYDNNCICDRFIIGRR